LPIYQAIKFEFVINLKTARTRSPGAAYAFGACRRGDRMRRRVLVPAPIFSRLTSLAGETC
jgi:hypothetical protein